MMFVSAIRVTRFALQNIWRNIWLSLIALSMLMLTLVTINILLVLHVVTDRAIELVEERIEVAVYFHDTVEAATVGSAVEYLRSLSQVRDVLVVSAEDSLERFVKRHANDPEILASLEELGKNPFGPTLIVKAHQVEDFPVILDALDNPQFRDAIREKDFSDYEEIIVRIRDMTDRIRLVGFVLALIFIAMTIVIVFNTVRMGIVIHREEIGIMKLVGASNAFVRAPFLLEMIFLSCTAVFLVALIAYPIVALLEPRFMTYFGGETAGLIEYFESNGLKIFGLQLLSLAALTLVSTSLAMKKYLEV